MDDGALGSFLPQWHELGSERQGTARLLEVIQQLQGLPIAWSALQSTVLPARVAGFHLDMLDMLAATGQVVWVGHSPLGTRDGRVVLYLREQVRELLTPVVDDPPDGRIAGAILDHLSVRGASFLFEIEDAVKAELGELSSNDFKTALWDLVWGGFVNNDTFAPLRSLAGCPQACTTLAGRQRARGRPLVARRRADGQRRAGYAACAGMGQHAARPLRHRQPRDGRGGRAAGWLRIRLQGVVGVGGVRRVRRGYFVEGLSGAQFARPGCVDRLRAASTDWRDDDDTAIDFLAVTDPANPWGSLLGWPDTGAPEAKVRPRRVAGAWLVTHRGHPLLYLGANGRSVLTFPANLTDPAIRNAAFSALHHVPKLNRRGALLIEKVDGVAVRDSKHCAELLESGFVSDYRGLSSNVAAV